MLVSLNSQAYIFLCTIILGMAVGLIYDIFRISRKLFKTRNFIVHIEDVTFWILVSVVIFGGLFLSNAGEIRGYALIGIVLGTVLYALIISHFVIKISISVITAISNISIFIYKKIKPPIRFLIRLFIAPIVFVYRICKSAAKYINKKKKAISRNANLNIKNIKNSLKKI